MIDAPNPPSAWRAADDARADGALPAPRDARDVAECLQSWRGPVETLGLGSKRAIGRPVDAACLDLGALRGIIDYEPAELVLRAHAATPLAEIDRALGDAGQRLAFEPPDLARLFGASPGQSVGGVVATNLAGSRRVVAGAARDHFLGFHAVDGRGHRFRAGGQVVKNVTGYDLPKLLAGSWGTLAVLTDVTLRTSPAAEVDSTLVMAAKSVEAATTMMRQALGSAHDVSAAAFMPGRGVALRLEGFEASVAARADALLKDLQAEVGEQHDAVASARLWREIGAADMLAPEPVIWRISVPPACAAEVVNALAPGRWLLDWGGGLIWAAFADVNATHVRAALTSGGHATLIKAPIEARRQVPVFQPLAGPVAALTSSIRAAFDPDRRLNPGRLD